MRRLFLARRLRLSLMYELISARSFYFIVVVGGLHESSTISRPGSSGFGLCNNLFSCIEDAEAWSAPRLGNAYKT
jgi:hypothetical protein